MTTDDDSHDDLIDSFNYANYDRLPEQLPDDLDDAGPNIVERHGDDLAIAYTVRRAGGETYLDLENEPDELTPWDWRFHRKFNDLVGDEPIPETPTQDDDIGIVVRRPFADEFAAGESVEWEEALERATGALAPAFEAMVEAVGEAIDAIARGDASAYVDDEGDE